MGPRRDRVVSLLAAIPEGFRVRKIPQGDFTCWMLYIRTSRKPTPFTGGMKESG